MLPEALKFNIKRKIYEGLMGKIMISYIFENFEILVYFVLVYEFRKNIASHMLSTLDLCFSTFLESWNIFEWNKILRSSKITDFIKNNVNIVLKMLSVNFTLSLCRYIINIL